MCLCRSPYTITISCLEIYAEHVYDLLVDERDRMSLAVRESPSEGFFLEGSKAVACGDKKVCFYVYVYILTYIHAHTHTHTYAHIYIYIYILIHAYLIHVYTHTYIYLYIQGCLQSDR